MSGENEMAAASCFDNLITDRHIVIGRRWRWYPENVSQTVCLCLCVPMSSAHSHDFIGEFTTSYRELSRGQNQFNVYEVRPRWTPFLPFVAELSLVYASPSWRRRGYSSEPTKSLSVIVVVSRVLMSNSLVFFWSERKHGNWVVPVCFWRWISLI